VLNTCCRLKLLSICKPSKLVVLASISLSSYPTVADEDYREAVDANARKLVEKYKQMEKALLPTV